MSAKEFNQLRPLYVKAIKQTLKYIGHTNEYFEVVSIDRTNNQSLSEIASDELAIVWFESEGNSLVIDAETKSFSRNDIICLTGLHRIDKSDINKARLLKFNSPFYCILKHDSEVGCKGVLFFGSRSLPLLQPNTQQLELLQAVWKVLLVEMAAKDNLQLEMLQMLLKRILILCTRIYKDQAAFSQLTQPQTHLVREFNYLVELHFREKHSVSEYAQLLHKSPKTLSNAFKKIGSDTPLQIIQSRLMLEGRRMLRYTDMPISELADQLGFNDLQSFSRFFKKNEGVSASEFRLNLN